MAEAYRLGLGQGRFFVPDATGCSLGESVRLLVLCEAWDIELAAEVVSPQARVRGRSGVGLRVAMSEEARLAFEVYFHRALPEFVEGMRSVPTGRQRAARRPVTESGQDAPSGDSGSSASASAPLHTEPRRRQTPLPALAGRAGSLAAESSQGEAKASGGAQSAPSVEEDRLVRAAERLQSGGFQPHWKAGGRRGSGPAVIERVEPPTERSVSSWLPLFLALGRARMSPVPLDEEGTLIARVRQWLDDARAATPGAALGVHGEATHAEVERAYAQLRQALCIREPAQTQSAQLLRAAELALEELARAWALWCEEAKRQAAHSSPRISIAGPGNARLRRVQHED